MNLVVLHGNITADPELRQTQSGTAVVKFTLAVKRKMPNKNGEYISDYHTCQMWGKRADVIARYFAKGSPIVVYGELQNNNYEKDGVKHYGYVINCENFDFVSSNKNSPAARGEKAAPVTNNSAPTGDFSDSGLNIEDFEEVVGEEVPF